VKDLNRKIQEHWNDDLDQTLRKLWALNNDDDEDTENMLLVPLVSPAKLEEIAQKLESVSTITPGLNVITIVSISDVLPQK
jgi:hypothetical protein